MLRLSAPGRALLSILALLPVACRESPTAPSREGSPIPDAAALAMANAIPITGCTVITEPGAYVIAAHLGICGDRPVVAIRASHVEVYARGHGIEGNLGPCISVGVGVPGGVSHVQLDGVDTRGCAGGIVFENVSYSVIQHATVWWNGLDGLLITGSAALSHHNSILESDFEANSANAISIRDGADMVIRNNFIGAGGRYTDRTAIRLSKVRRIQVSDNIVSRYDYGIVIDNQSDHNVITGNTIDDVSYNGILAGGERDNVRGNSVHHAGEGITVYGRLNTIAHNNVTNNM
jgi:parallel beta-helix repeat protein